MSYFILRDGLQYGPYSRTELRRYLHMGELYPGDLGRSEETNQWLPVSQMLGTAPPPPPSGSGGSGSDQRAANESGVIGLRSASRHLPPRFALAQPQPPAFNWVVLLLLAVLTCGIFGWAWAFVVAQWTRAIDPRNRAVLLLGISLFLNIAAAATLYAGHRVLAGFIQVAGIALFLSAMFAIRRSIHVCYIPVQDESLALSAVMTFFFSVIYFQFKFNRAMSARSLSHRYVEAPRSAP